MNPVKTIQSISEAIMFNLLPPELVTHLLAFFKNIIPLAGLVLIRIFLLGSIFLQRINSIIYRKFNQLLGDNEVPAGLQWEKQT